MKRLALLLVALVVVAGCAGDDEEADTDTGTTTTAAEATDVRLYFLRDGKVWPVRREVDATAGIETAAVAALLAGPSEQEAAELELTTAIPEDGEEAEVSVDGSLAAVQLDVQLTDEGLAQVVYTLTQFPGIEQVELQERFLTRADFEEQTPAILVESPLAFEEVTSPLEASGTANTFEANFQYELLAGDGRKVDENFVTATSGSGTRGTFDFTTKEFDDVGALVVFELSAEDGSRINEVEIPLQTAQ